MAATSSNPMPTREMGSSHTDGIKKRKKKGCLHICETAALVIVFFYERARLPFLSLNDEIGSAVTQNSIAPSLGVPGGLGRG